jgi:hypothetical protein
MDMQEPVTTTFDRPLLTKVGRALHQTATRFAAGVEGATISTGISDIEEYRANALSGQPPSLPHAGPPDRSERPLTGRMADGPGPLIDYPDGYFRPIPSDFDGALERSDIPFTRRVYNRSGRIMGEVERVREDGVVVIRPVRGPRPVSHFYALYTHRRYVPMADA